jgi:hypothetical protein
MAVLILCQKPQVYLVLLQYISVDYDGTVIVKRLLTEQFTKKLEAPMSTSVLLHIVAATSSLF